MMTYEEKQEVDREHENFDGLNPPKNSPIPGRVKAFNDAADLLSTKIKLEWNVEKKTYVNELGIEYSPQLILELCGIMGLDTDVELFNIVIDESLRKVRKLMRII